MGDWSNLPKDIIRLFVERLEFLSDIQRFAFVCLSWRSVAMESDHLFHPLLITSYAEDAETCNLYAPVDKKAFKLHLPELRNKRCCGTANGWLITVDDDLVVRLLHPFSRAEVMLPPFTPLSPNAAGFLEALKWGHPGKSNWKSYFVVKVISSSNPLNPDSIFIKVGGLYREVSFCRATDDTWTVLNPDWSEFVDAIFYEGWLYATHSSGWPTVWDISSNTEGLIIGPSCSELREECEDPAYLVESSGDLLNVIRHLEQDEEEQGTTHKTLGFEVFKLAYKEAAAFALFKSTHKKEDAYKAADPWERVTCLGDRALFVGRNQSFCLLAASYPGYRANCIYFTDDSEGGLDCCDMGEFNLEDGSVTYLDLADHVMHWPPVWLKQH